MGCLHTTEAARQHRNTLHARLPPAPQAQAKRAAVRKTWVRHARQHLPNVAIHFVLAQVSCRGGGAGGAEVSKAHYLTLEALPHPLCLPSLLAAAIH